MAASARRTQVRECSTLGTRGSVLLRRPSSSRTSLCAAASLVVSRRPTEQRARNNSALATREVRALSSDPAALADASVSSAALMAVEVHSLAGNTVLQTEVSVNERVSILKLQVHAAIEVDVDRLLLIWNDTLLKDSDVLGELFASRSEGGGLESGTNESAMVLQLSVLPALPEEAQRALDSAAEALNCLDKRSISELKGFGRPPPECVDVVAACAYLLTNTTKKMDWKGAQKLMNNPASFIDQCKAFDVREIPHQTLANVDALLALHFFNFDTMKGKSMAAAWLSNWVINVVLYHKTYIAVIRTHYQT